MRLADSPALNRIAKITATALGVASAGISAKASTGPRLIASYGEVPQEALDMKAVEADGSSAGGLFAAVSFGGESGGVLWIADPKPRSLDAAARNLLDSLAALAQRECSPDQQARDRIEDLSRRLVAPAVHQMRGALTSIAGFAEFLRSQPGSQAQTEPLSIIHEQAGQLGALLEELVQLWHLEIEGHAALKLAPESVEPMLRAAAAAVNVPLHLVLEQQLPQVRLDRDSMSRVFRRLLTFAAAAEQRSPVEVVLRTAKGARIEIQIRHAFTDLDPRDLPRLVEPFFRPLHTDAPREGLGLARAAKEVELLGGELRVASLPPHGLEVVLSLPA